MGAQRLSQSLSYSGTCVAASTGYRCAAPKQQQHIISTAAFAARHHVEGPSARFAPPREWRLVRVPCIPSRFDGTSTPPRTRLAPALPPDRGEAGCLRVGRAPVAEAVKPWASVFTELDLAAGGIPRLGVQPCWPSFPGIGAACTMSNMCAASIGRGSARASVVLVCPLPHPQSKTAFRFLFHNLSQRQQCRGTRQAEGGPPSDVKRAGTCRSQPISLQSF